MKFASGYCEIFDACVFVAVLVSLGYLISYGSQTPYEEEREDMVSYGAEDLTTDNNYASTSSCSAEPQNTIELAVDLEYSKDTPLSQLDLLTPAEVRDIGDTILDNLFNMCSCKGVSTYCFVWTLTINEMNFSRSNYGPCGPSQCKPANECSPPILDNTVPRNATVAKIYAKKLSTLPTNLPCCLENTVKCAIYASGKGQKLFSSSYVETFLINIFPNS